ncbi:hypothetical protein C5748_22430 [Phyllobacterium phragmitis]|uniref:NADH-quinone oxidoreductase subunit E n=1 Tax=Phyllobacterium phragmitis TaxID=2670329 RepID=A0A2S9IL89_9HYPH|nr:hypothetical protein [Phyllobacterium phragmitis]PRD41262.1 hypothetical protein C5748_22430 [Phyllobacterium phragmitis]
MLYLTEFHSAWLLLSLMLGGIVGWLSFLHEKPGWSGAGWLNIGIPAFLIGLAVAAFKLLPGEAGYWLDLGLLFFGSYIFGCLLGSLMRGLLAGHAEPVPAVGVAAAGAAAVGARKTAHRVSSASTAPSHPGRKPPVLASKNITDRDDLKLIKGIGPKNERVLNALGIHTFRQIAAWTPEEAEWMGHHMAFPGRIERELWIDQAKVLAAGGETEHSRAVRAGQPLDDKPIGDTDIAKLKSGLPQALDQVEGEDQHEGKRPFGMVKPQGVADDLKLIDGIGKQNEARLHGLGIWHFSQIAAWDRDNINWIGSYLAFPGRIDREQWVDQAKILAKGGTTEFAERVKRGDVASSEDDGSRGQSNIVKIKR